MVDSATARGGPIVCFAFGLLACTETPNRSDDKDIRSPKIRIITAPKDTPGEVLKANIERCWNPPVANAESAYKPVTVKIDFKRDGNLAKTPAVQSTMKTDFDRLVAESVIRAVLRCAPYEGSKNWALPKNLTITFDVKKMLT